ncbi:MAG: HAD hydrolase-like protein [Chloroflexi bacterium]|jgi:phosphoglycolate phosphatase-like HAD superfamily hydrolase|nr:HAD hydrolase-like protein [Chloroflexota bacterium]
MPASSASGAATLGVPHSQPENSAAHSFLVGVDSDGCVFDTMECKHKECFIPATIRYWGLQAVSRYARQAAEFVNLYSAWRGTNRWPALVKTLDLLAAMPAVQARGFCVPPLPAVRALVQEEVAPSNLTLVRRIAQTGDPELERALEWSEAVNRAIEEIVHGISPFGQARTSLERMASEAQVVVVSQTPTEALEREWREHGIDQFVSAINGQEMGTKQEHLVKAGAASYPAGHVLMIGDALGDVAAARAVGARFFPIVPGAEDASWSLFEKEALGRFFDGGYTAAYEAGLLVAFQEALPSRPPWER